MPVRGAEQTAAVPSRQKNEQNVHVMTVTPDADSAAVCQSSGTNARPRTTRESASSFGQLLFVHKRFRNIKLNLAEQSWFF